MRRSLVAVLVLLVLSGCSAAPDAPEATLSPTSASTTTTEALLPTVELTDTLHLLQAPHVEGTAPTGTEIFRSPIRSTSGSPRIGPVEYHDWILPRPAALTYVTGSATIWVEFTGPVINPVPTDPCFWRIDLNFIRNTTTSGGNPTGIAMTDAVCAPQAEPLPAGVHKLEVTFPGKPVPNNAGGQMILVVTSQAYMTPDANVYVLSGTPEYDSRLTLNGLQVPLDTRTYL